MFTVSTYLDRSTIQGIGVFSGENIPRGTIVWRFDPRLDLEFEPGQWQDLKKSIPAACFNVLRRYSYKEKNRFYLCPDNAQFMNHGSTHYNVENNGPDNTMFARTAILKGEELICNYFEFCDPDDFNLRRIR